MIARPAPDEDVWWSGLRWAEAGHMQVWRFQEGFKEGVKEEMAALADAEFRHRLDDDSENSRSWRESLDANHEPYDPERPLRVPSWGAAPRAPRGSRSSGDPRAAGSSGSG
jgi:hypothetical protein